MQVHQGNVRRQLQLSALGLALTFTPGCRRDQALDFTLVSRTGGSLLERPGCPPARRDLSTLDAPLPRAARFAPGAGLSAGPVVRLEPAWPRPAPDGFVFVATLELEAPRACDDDGWRPPRGFFRAQPVSLAQVRAGRFELHGEGSAPAGSGGRFTWDWRFVYEARATAERLPPPALASWDHCLEELTFADEPEPLEEPGTVALDDGGCETLTLSQDGDARVFTHRKVFGTRLTVSPQQGTVSEPVVRVVDEVRRSPSGSFEWFDEDGDGHRELERRVTLGPDGARRVEQTAWTAGGALAERSVIEDDADGGRRVTQQDFVDGGWVTRDAFQTTRAHPPRLELQPLRNAP